VYSGRVWLFAFRRRTRVGCFALVCIIIYDFGWGGIGVSWNSSGGVLSLM